MKNWIIIGGLLISSGFSFGREHHPPPPEPNEFVVATATHFDFGPPLNYYALYLVQATATGTAIEKVMLTPAGGSCMQPPEVDDKIVTLDESVQALLEGRNPCSIPEKEIGRELKRCKRCRVFSFASTSIQTQCGAKTLVIRSSVFDKDWFDPNANTPKNTSWSMRLQERLGSAVGERL